MQLTRKAFCASLVGATVSVWLEGCGGGGYSSDAPAGPGSGCGASGGDISANHGHALSIPKADLDSSTAKTYTLTPSTEGHVHTVSFTPAQLAQLKAGASIMVTSSTTVASAIYGGTHSHEVTAKVNVATCP